MKNRKISYNTKKKKINTTLFHQENAKKNVSWTTHYITFCSYFAYGNLVTARKLSLLVCSSAHLYLKYNGVNVI